MTSINLTSRRISEREVILDAEIDEQIRKADNADEETLAYLLDKIRKRRAVMAIKPEFTPEVVGIAKQIIAFGGAGFGFVLTFGLSETKLSALTVALATLYLNLTMVALAVLVFFFFQARTRYPWLYLDRLGNSSQYFYYNAIPLDFKFRPLLSAGQLAASLEKYLDNLASFTSGVLRENKREELKNELIQYHLLIFYQGYLDQYEQQLTHTALYGFSASIIGAFFVIVARCLVGVS